MITQTQPSAPDEIMIPVQPAAGRWWVVPLLVLVALLLGCAMLAAFVFLRYQMATRAALAEVAAEVKRIQASGEPITVEDLYAHRNVKDGVQDTTRLWLAALGSFNDGTITADGKALPYVGTLTDEDAAARLAPAAPGSLHAEAVAFLEKYDATVQATLAAAGANGECRFHVKFEDGVATLLPHVQGLRTLARIFKLRLNVQKANGDIEGALESLEVLYAIPKTIDYESMLIGHMVQVAILGVAQYETGELMNDVQLTDGQLGRLEQLVAADDLQSGLTAGLIGERGMNYYTFHHLETIGDSLPLNMASNGTLTRPADCLLSLELMADLIEASQQPFPDALHRVGVVNQRIKSIVGSGNPLEKWNYMITALMMPAVGSGFEATANGIARQRTLLAAIAAERHRLATGALPARLSDLVPDYRDSLPPDPFDGQPLRMIAKPGGLVIYSIGQNKLDDGGTESGQSDIVVRLLKTKGPEERQENVGQENKADDGEP